jgi:hypothetical protein
MNAAAAARPGVALYLIVATVWALGHVGLAAIGTTPILQGRIPDTDGYMWLARIELLWRGGAWFDATMPRANAPLGDVLNWTRPVDVAISLLALPLTPFMPLRSALFAGGALVSPLFHLATILLIAWAARPLVDAETRPLVALVAVASMGLFAYSVVGRPDHHALVATALALLVGGALRLPFGRGIVPFAVAVAAGLWLTTEFQMPLALVIAAAAAAWVLDPTPARAEMQARGWGAAILATVLALAIERGPGGMLVREADKISLDQVAVVVAAALFWAVLVSLRDRLIGPVARASAAIATGATLAVALVVLLPGIERGPGGAIDPRVMEVFLGESMEMRSLLGWNLDSLVDQLRLNALCGAGAVAAAIWWLRGRGTPEAAGWATIAVLAAGYFVATSLHVRFAMFGMIGAAIAVAELLRLVRARIVGGIGAVLARASLMALIVAGPLVLGILMSGREGGAADRVMRALDADCDVGAVVPLLNRRDGFGARPRIVIAHANFGSELIWRTPHGVLGTPFHRNRDGILDGRAFFDAREDAAAQAIAARRGAELVLFCPLLANENPPGSLGRRLQAGEIPLWLAAEPLQNTALRLYRVVAP